VNEIISFGLNVNYKIVEKREGDPPCLIADPSLAEKLLNWNATSSSINKIIKSAITWHLKPKA
jgi:UDP-glucose 4-epimerase